MAELKAEDGSQMLWTPIGGGDALKNADSDGYDKSTPEHKFKGNFDGNGKTIKNLKIEAATNFVGLFGCNIGIISDLTVEGNIKVTGAYDYIAGVAAFNAGTIQKVISKVTIDAGGCYNVGGIAGINVGYEGKWKDSNDKNCDVKDASGVITKCGNEGKLTGYRVVGGITGKNFGEVIYCYNYGDIDFLWHGSMSKIGGIVGTSGDTNAEYGKGDINCCYNTGAINWINTVESSKGYGGIVCFISRASGVYNCYSIGSLKVGRGDHTPIVPRYDATNKIVNNYSLDTIKIAYMDDLKNEYMSGKQRSEAEFKSEKFLTEIGGAYEADTKNINNGFPVLKWQNGKENVATKIEIDTSEMQLEYTVGQTVKTTGMKAYLVYADNTKELIPEGFYKVEKTDKLTEADNGQKVKVSCTAQGLTGEGEITISIYQKQLDRIELTSRPTNYKYRAGETFDATGMKVRAYYSNDSLSASEKSEVVEGYKVTAPEKLSPKDNTITISYKLNGATKKETFDVIVKDQSNAPEKDKDGVYQIKTADDLVWFANEVTYFGNNTIKGCLVEDIDVSGNEDFVSIGCKNKQLTQTTGVSKTTFTYSWSNDFKGTLDGNGKTITMKLDGKQYIALVGSASGATIKNLTVAGSVNGAGSYVAGIVAYADAKSSIVNCVNKADITNTNNYTGGIAGDCKGTITNCKNIGTVSASGIAGGIAGSAVTLKDCMNEGKVATTGDTVGGVVGFAPTTVSGCINNGNVTSGNSYAGGIVGRANSYGTSANLSDCANLAEVQAKDGAAGMVASGKVDKIENCYNKGTIKATAATGKKGVAGIIAEKTASNALEIANCYNIGQVTSGAGSATDAAKGEIIAYANVSNAKIATIKNSYYLAGNGKVSIGKTVENVKNEDASLAKTAAEFSSLAETLGDAYQDSCCGPVFKTQDVVAHKEVKVDEKKPTCTEEGLKEGTYCEVCGAVVTAQDVIPAEGHQWAKDYTVDKVATTKENGCKSYHCTVCDAVKDGSEIAIAKIATVTLSSTEYTYSGKTKAPVVTVKDGSGTNLVKNEDYTVKYASGRKYVGTYKVTVTFKGDYSGAVEKTFKINPMPTKITSKAGSKSAFTVKWKKVSSQATGYQIRYSTSSKMSSAKVATVKSYKDTSKTISKLKSKRMYYVQIRTYKKVSDKNYYSDWSSKISVKTK